jgi:small subunit ribosomal protein S17e
LQGFALNRGYNLGKVRTETVKRAAREVVEKFPDKFTNEFEANKLHVNEVLRAPSKRLRNRIAGYVTRLKVIEAKKATMMQMSPEAQLGLGEEEEDQSQGGDTAPAA